MDVLLAAVIALLSLSLSLASLRDDAHPQIVENALNCVSLSGDDTRGYSSPPSPPPPLFVARGVACGRLRSHRNIL